MSALYAKGIVLKTHVMFIVLWVILIMEHYGIL